LFLCEERPGFYSETLFNYPRRKPSCGEQGAVCFLTTIMEKLWQFRMQNFSGCRRGRRRISSGLCSQMLVTCFAISVIHNFVADIYTVVTREISTVSVSPQQNELRVHVLVQLVWKFIRPPPPTIVIIRVKSGCGRGALGDAARSSEFSSTNEPKMLCYF
jgi:hypothetical protein